VIAAEGKLRSLKSLRVDTGDPNLDEALRGSIKVISDYKKERMMNIQQL
jgi:predicted polyphosphate/ATP-dependent NAD kinase